MAGRIEKLSPDQAGLALPNPEYPWQDAATNRVFAPADYLFGEFDPRDPRMIKMDRLVNDLLRIIA